MTIFVLGSHDAEMAAIQRLLDSVNFPYLFASTQNLDGSYRRVRPGERATCACDSQMRAVDIDPSDLMGIEVAGPWGAAKIDHHDPHPLSRLGPDKFFEASSIGQVVACLAGMGIAPDDWPSGLSAYSGDVPGSDANLFFPGSIVYHPVAGYSVCTHDERGWGSRWVSIPNHVVLTAAADHCPAAACTGACPGVDASTVRTFLCAEKISTYFPNWSIEFAIERLIESKATLLAAPLAAEFPDGHVRDLRHLAPGDEPTSIGEYYPREFILGILASLLTGEAFVCLIRRADGKLALRSNGHGLHTPAGESPARIFLADPSAFGCGPCEPRGQDASYGNPTRGFFGGTLIDQRL